MEYVNLGNTDIKVSKVCLGCMGFGDPQQECILGHFLMKNPKKSLNMPLIKESTFLIQQWVIKVEHQKNIWDVQLKNFQKRRCCYCD